MKAWFERGPILHCGLRLRRQRVLKELSRHLREARQRRADLTDAVGRIEHHFTTIGGLLEKLTASGTRLVEESQNLHRLASGRLEGETVLESANGLLQAPLNYLESCADSLGSLVDRLHSCEDRTRRILGLRQQLEATIAPLNYIQILYRVESSGLPPDLQQMFSTVSQDIARLEEKVAGMFREKFSVLAAMHGTIHRVLSHLASVLPERRRIGGEKKQQIAKTLVELQLELEKNASRDVRLSATTRSIAEQISNVVVGLQYHDIVAQKTRHLDALHAEVEQIGADLEAGGSQDLWLSLCSLQERNQLQRGHLAAILGDLDEAMSTIAGGVHTTIENTRGLDEGCVALTELNKVTVAPDGMIQVLLDTIAETREIVRSALADAERALAELAPIAATANSLTSTMSELSHTMHLIALNAQIQAVQVGEGTGLEVLAAKTVVVAEATTAFSNEALEKLDKLAVAIMDATSSLEELREAGSEHSRNLEGRGREMEGELHELRNRSLAALSAVGAHTRSIQELAAEVLQHCDRDAEVDASFAAASENLDQVRDVLQDAIGSLKKPARQAREHWWHRYTMASERDIHAAVMGEGSAERTSMVKHAEENTELFGTDTPFSGAAVAVAAPTAETSKAKAAADLGSNVDLF